MRILVLADIDEFRWRWGTGKADLVLSCGDVDDHMILEAADAYGCPTIFAVKGNQDLGSPFSPPIVDVHLRVHEHDGVTFGGMNGSWKYKPVGHFLYTQSEATLLLAELPPVDVVVSHNSPQGIHDREDEVHYGFEGLRVYMDRAKPDVLVHGHQSVDKETLVGGTRVIGVCGHNVIEI